MNKKIKILVATTNKGKRSEIAKYFESVEFKVEFQFSDLDISMNIDESGDTFAQNAYLKALAYEEEAALQSMSVLTEDSGLVLADFPEIMGVKTARFQDCLATYEERAEKLLSFYREQKIAPPYQATFYCVLCLRINKEETYFFTGKVAGSLADKWRPGMGGFGYDGVFIPEGEKHTFSENPELKSTFSHRKKAFDEMVKFLRPLYF